jgi:hypothetical protein
VECHGKEVFAINRGAIGAYSTRAKYQIDS